MVISSPNLRFLVAKLTARNRGNRPAFRASSTYVLVFLPVLVLLSILAFLPVLVFLLVNDDELYRVRPNTRIGPTLQGNATPTI
jgi:hypothetical protein